jgi:hypothetical protein
LNIYHIINQPKKDRQIGDDIYLQNDKMITNRTKKKHCTSSCPRRKGSKTTKKKKEKENRGKKLW